jgi:predicted short-subunit dehydrogenase-like oxidoreductase (DUF2520 family)
MSIHPKITILGAGKVAFQLGRRLRKIGFSMHEVWARDAEKARILADELTAELVVDFSKISSEADLFLLAVSDSGIAEVAEKLKKINPKGIVLHCSGATSRTILSANYGEKTAVLWPIHSFSRENPPDWSKISLILEMGDDHETQIFLKKWMPKIGENIQFSSGDNRARMHLAATFVNNFSNHLLVLAEAFLAKNEVEFPALRQLFLETAQKIQTIEPRLAQTGPAARNDSKTLEKHENLLENEPNMLKIYQNLSKSIQKLQ